MACRPSAPQVPAQHRFGSPSHRAVPPVHFMRLPSLGQGNPSRMMTELQNELLEGLDAIVWEADPVSLQFTYVSRGAERLLGYSLDHWLERPAFWGDLLHPDDRDQAVAFCRAAVADCKDHEFEYRMIASDGRVLWIRDIVSVICNGHGATGLRGVMLDVSDRKQAESARE